MLNRWSDLLIVIALTLAAMVAALTGLNESGLRAILGLPLVLILPGYAMTAALYPIHAPGLAERLLFAVGLSLAVTVLGGFVLNVTPWGLQAQAWAMWLGSLTLVASMIAWVRRYRQPPILTHPRLVELNPQQGLLFGLAALAIVAALGIARQGALQQPSAPFTPLWMLAADGADPNTVRLGIVNMESGSMRYKLQVKVGNRIVREWNEIVLAQGEKWENTFVLPASPSESDAVEALLYRWDAPETVYRRSVLWPRGTQK